MAKSLFELRDRVRVAPAWLIPGFFKRQNTMYIMGQPKKACKSWLVLAMCWDLSEGHAIWGMDSFTPEKPLRSVYFTQEDAEDDIQDRAMAHLLNAKREPNDRLWVVPKDLNLVLDTWDGKDGIQRELDEVRERAGAVDLVVFDPMRDMHHGNENDSLTINQIKGVVERIHKRYNCATVFTHHTVKPPRDGDWDPSDPFAGRGSGAIYGSGDAFVMVVPGKGTAEHRRLALHFESKRGKPLPPALVKVHYASGRVEFMGAAEPEGEDNGL